MHTWTFNECGIGRSETMSEQQGRHSLINIKDEHNKENLTTRQKEMSEPHKTLGIMKTISGCEKAQVAFLKEKSDKFASKVANAKLSRHLAMIAYRTMYVPSITYGLPATNLSEEDLNKT